MRDKYKELKECGQDTVIICWYVQGRSRNQGEVENADAIRGVEWCSMTVFKAKSIAPEFTVIGCRLRMKKG